MKFFFILLLSVTLASCNKNPNSDSKPDEVFIDKISASDTYQNYVSAYNDYKACKEARPKLTQDYMAEKITADEFKDAITRNTKVCNIKKDIFDRYYRLLQAEFDQEAAVYKIQEK